MRFEFPADCAFGCNVNAHRSLWNGQICKAASSWDCGAKQDFRDDYCEAGDSRCYHLNAFGETNPSIVIDNNGGSWLLEDEPDALEDQILLLWGGFALEPRGVTEQRSAIVFGAYRVSRVEPRQRTSYTEWIVRPHPDGWARFARLKLSVPRWEPLPGPYLKRVDRSAVENLFQRALQLAKETPAGAADPDHERLARFARELPKWLDQAAKRAQKLRARYTKPAASTGASASPLVNRPLKDLADKVRLLPATQVASSGSKPVALQESLAAAPSSALEGLEGGLRARLEARHGPDVLAAVQVGWMTKPLLILRGSPGVGKSDLACRLVEDPSGERLLTVAVDPTWRGREDLLGHVNPIDNQFEPTSVTNFLRRAALAWDKGDRRAFVIVFEEFNLSQPEHWLSEVLVRSQYPHGAREERMIHLGGAGVRGWPERGPGRVWLSPALRLVGTVNSDHTVRSLSPRVLDRAAVVTLSVQPHEALRRVGLELAKEELDAVADLDFRLRQRGAVFSYRTAESLRACFARLGEASMDRCRALDLVLLQEVLSKVRLLAADPADLRLCEDLVEWTESAGQSLLECQRVIASWMEALRNGQDVQQT